MVGDEVGATVSLAFVGFDVVGAIVGEVVGDSVGLRVVPGVGGKVEAL